MYSVPQESSHLKNNWFAVNELKQAKLSQCFVKIGFYSNFLRVYVRVDPATTEARTLSWRTKPLGLCWATSTSAPPTNRRWGFLCPFYLFQSGLSPARHGITNLSAFTSKRRDFFPRLSLCTLDNDPQRPGGRERRAHQLRWRRNLWKASH